MKISEVFYKLTNFKYSTPIEINVNGLTTTYNSIKDVPVEYWNSDIAYFTVLDASVYRRTKLKFYLQEVKTR